MGMEVLITKPQGVVPGEVWRCPRGLLPACCVTVTEDRHSWLALLCPPHL